MENNCEKQKLVTAEHTNLLKRYMEASLVDAEHLQDLRIIINLLMEHIRVYAIEVNEGDDDYEKSKDFVKAKADELDIDIEEAQRRYGEGLQEYPLDLVLHIRATGEEFSRYCMWRNMPTEVAVKMGKSSAEAAARHQVQQFIKQQLSRG